MADDPLPPRLPAPPVRWARFCCDLCGHRWELVVPDSATLYAYAACPVCSADRPGDMPRALQTPER